MTEQKINLNTATPRELIQLPGIGPTLAVRIVTYRETVHPFEEPIEVTAVPGISENIYRAIADRLTVEDSEEGQEDEEIEEVEEMDVTPSQAEPQDEASEPIPAERALVKPTPPPEPRRNRSQARLHRHPRRLSRRALLQPGLAALGWPSPR